MQKSFAKRRANASRSVSRKRRSGVRRNMQRRSPMQRRLPDTKKMNKAVKKEIDNFTEPESKITPRLRRRAAAMAMYRLKKYYN